MNMTENLSTKRLIANRLIEMVPRSRKRVTVSALTSNVGIDRKTFYYYFDGIDDAMIWIYRDYLAKMLASRSFDEWEIDYPSPSLRDKYAQMPFYARNKTADHRLEQAMYFKQMCYHWEDHRAYYSKVFCGDLYISLFDYIIDLFLPAFKDDVIYLLDGREQPDVITNFLAEYHVMGVFGRLRYHFARTNQFIMQEELNSCWNHAHSLMSTVIQNTPPDQILVSQKRNPPPR